MRIALFGPIGVPELLIVLFIIILIFGASRLSGLGRGVGRAIRGFKQEMKEMKEENEDDEDEPR
jgi:sec-independent protein translocase protein TatA